METRTAGFTALHIASQIGNTEVVAALLAAGADKEAKLPNGATALQIASECGHTAVVEALLAAEADRSAEDKPARTTGRRSVPKGRSRTARGLIGPAG
ncbi:Ankyrin repeat domain-containing protein 39 [Tetrabaena socialis]|uniref:Ankyrin repeat domain-containing protein 39 n=1 Tax=Tetrabaena socialis TaxID=47790 RepID=A0A2J7ZGR4_9CHLO|nr:Ankyrin repeat domain-containing protein 39 [Tetrabaena socialis]|eukprot:PNG99447.1 Ankyrin repeat domain-containing protein 39 [Tetrabaena socialis]